MTIIITGKNSEDIHCVNWLPQFNQLQIQIQ